MFSQSTWKYVVSFFCIFAALWFGMARLRRYLHVLGGVQRCKSPADGAGGVGVSNITAPKRHVTQKFQQFCTRKAQERLCRGGEESSTGQEGMDPLLPVPSPPCHVVLVGTGHPVAWGPRRHSAGVRVQDLPFPTGQGWRVLPHLAGYKRGNSGSHSCPPSHILVQGTGVCNCSGGERWLSLAFERGEKRGVIRRVHHRGKQPNR